MSKKSYRHLSYDQRCIIENGLNQDLKLIQISEIVGKDPRCIKYEIEHHKYLKVNKRYKNTCGKQEHCQIRRLCNQCDSGLCRYCSFSSCNQICDHFTQEPECKRIHRYPGVCNGCPSLDSCKLPKLFYSASLSQSEYKNNISLHKRGTKLSNIQLRELDRVISHGVKRGLSIEVIIYKENLDIAASTVYRLIDQNMLSVKNIDLKRKVRYRPRITSKPKLKPLNYEYLHNRRPEDYVQFISEHPNANIWQMDTIEGVKGKDEPVILSLLYTKTNLQLFFLMDACTTYEVDKVFRGIKSYLGDDLFKETFECILTDNGKEFKDPLAIETSEITGEILTRVYYCRPRHSEEKGKCEKNHEHFREFIPKGKSFKGYNQRDINFISNQINNYPRPSLQFETPYELTLKFLNKKVVELNDLTPIPINQIILKPLKK